MRLWLFVRDLGGEVVLAAWLGLQFLLIGGLMFVCVLLSVWKILVVLGVHLTTIQSRGGVAVLVGAGALSGAMMVWWFVWEWRRVHLHHVCRRIGLVITERKGKEVASIMPRLIAVRRVTRWVKQVGLDLPAGITYEEVRTKAEALASGMGWHALRLQRDATRPARVWLEAALAPLPVLVPLSRQPLPQRPLEFFLGASPWGPLWCDLAACPHLLIAGETGMGKSTLLHSVLGSMLYLRNPTQQEVRRLLVWLIDLKGGLEFARYENSLAVVDVAGDWDSALSVLEVFVDELERRLLFLRSVSCASIAEFWQRFPARRAELLPGVLVIDELAQLTLAPVSRVEHVKMLSLLHRVTSIGRALGLHVIVATQRPDMDVLPGSIRANIPAVVCFRVRDETNSRLVLDDAAAALLPAVPGRGIYRYGPDLTEFQGACCDLDMQQGMARMQKVGTQANPDGQEDVLLSSEVQVT